MIRRLLVTKALVAALEAGTGKRCGHGRLPVVPTTGAAVEPPYLVLYPLDRTDSGSPLGNAGDWTELEYQLTAVGGARLDQAEWMDDKGQEVLVGQTSSGVFTTAIAIPGHVLAGRRLVGGGVPDEAGGIVSIVSRYVLTVTGA